MRAPLRFRLARFLLRLILGSLFRVRLEGAYRLPGSGPYLLTCNHLSWVDPFLLLAWLPPSPRIHFLGRRSAIPNPSGIARTAWNTPTLTASFTPSG